MLRKLNSHMQRNEVGPYTKITSNNGSKTKFKDNTIKLLEESIEECIHDHGFNNDFLCGIKNTAYK